MLKDSLSAKHLLVYGSRYGVLPINLTNCAKSVYSTDFPSCRDVASLSMCGAFDSLRQLLWRSTYQPH